MSLWFGDMPASIMSLLIGCWPCIGRLPMPTEAGIMDEPPTDGTEAGIAIIASALGVAIMLVSIGFSEARLRGCGCVVAGMGIAGCCCGWPVSCANCCAVRSMSRGLIAAEAASVGTTGDVGTGAGAAVAAAKVSGRITGRGDAVRVPAFVAPAPAS